MKLVIIICLGISFVVNAKVQSLRFIGDYNIKTGTIFKNYEIGGLSGLIYDETSSQYFAISDDDGKKGPLRIFKFKIQINRNSIIVTPSDLMLLKNSVGELFPVGRTRFKGIATLSNKNIALIGTGDSQLSPRLPPEIVEVTDTGRIIKSLEIPIKFIPEKLGSISHGVATFFSALSTLPMRSNLYLAAEGALIQDQVEANTFPLRILSYQLNNEGVYVASNEYAYPMKKEIEQSVIGDILAIDNQELLVIEKKIDSGNKKFVQIYRTIFDEDTLDVRSFYTLKNVSFKYLKKDLLLDLETITKSLNKEYPTISNIEGICLGPNLENGNKSLVLVSNNLFSDVQRTQFLVFEIIDQAKEVGE